ncbi:MAG: FtsX-like permease family protein [Bacteroidales bacterium]|jgi:ABC-type lipoprotein release transport system permease subunit|nr:FtsX-like permease family protein [Bacteroidales bacterium]
MKDYQLAWKNLWRNKRRTLITAASVFFAVFFALVMRSFQLGTYDSMYKNVIESYTGYIQIQHQDYAEEPILDNSFEADPEMMKKVKSDPNVKDVVPRLESYTLAASGSRTQGVMMLGVDPEKEENLSGMRDRLVKFKLTEDAIEALKSTDLPDRTLRLLDLFRNEAYSSTGRMMLDLGISTEDSTVVLPVLRRNASFTNKYFSGSSDGEVLIGSGLSDFLKINVGDTLILMGQGYHGTSAAGNFIVAGIIKLPSPDIDKRIVYMPLETARELYAAPGLATSAVLSLKDFDDKSIDKTAVRLKTFVADPLAVKTWRELNALLLNQMEADNRSGMIMIGILYLVIAFGVFGTVLMMMAERRREFGMLVSVGMQKSKLAKVVTIEMFLMGLLGVISGIIASLPLVYYGHFRPLRFTGEYARMYEDYGMEPVMPTLLPDTYYLWQTVVVMIIISIAIIFSVRKIFRIDLISSLKA